MKNLITKNLNRFVFVTVLAVATMIAKGLAGNVMAQCLATADGTGLETQVLYAGQTIYAGTVSAQIVGDFLEVTYNTTGGWELNEAHLWIGDDIAHMPQTRQGSPKIGNFPYHASYDPSFTPGDTSYTVRISLNVIGFSCPSADTTYYVAAHAELQKVDGSGAVTQTETGWADGDRFAEKGMWGTLFDITMTCGCDYGSSSNEITCETAFASGDTCFLDIDEDNDGKGDFNRWGWTLGPLSAGSYLFDIYAGAGQCDTTKGTFAGTLTLNYDGSVATVIYDMAGGFTMDETQLYVGNEILARDVNGEYTVAPGQYGNIHDLTDAGSDIFVIENLSGDIYVVAHSVTCGEY